MILKNAFVSVPHILQCLCLETLLSFASVILSLMPSRARIAILGAHIILISTLAFRVMTDMRVCLAKLEWICHSLHNAGPHPGITKRSCENIGNERAERGEWGQTGARGNRLIDRQIKRLFNTFLQQSQSIRSSVLLCLHLASDVRRRLDHFFSDFESFPNSTRYFLYITAKCASTQCYRQMCRVYLTLMEESRARSGLCVNKQHLSLTSEQYNLMNQITYHWNIRSACRAAEWDCS